MHAISRRHLLGSAAALLAGGLAACGGSGNDGTRATRTTLLVYLLGSNLESENDAGTANLLEMLAAQGSAHTHVVITTGGAQKDDPAGLVSSWRTVKRFELANGQLKELADLGACNMDAGDTLEDFLSWAARAYPADRYMLALWDHGSGYYGYGGDENFPSGKSMSLPAMAAALQGFQKNTGITLDYIGFDACLMATVEVAKMLQPYARYLGASQELEPGSGWDWRALIETASRQPAPSVPEFGKTVATAFVDKQARERPQDSPIPPLSDYATFSIIDLSRIAPLLERLDAWARAVHAYYDNSAKSAHAGGGVFWPPTFSTPRPQARSLPGAAGDTAIERWKQVAMSRLRTIAFGYVPAAKDALDLVDLRQFAALLGAEGIAASAQAALGQALQDAIVFNITGPRARSASGLSIYFPQLRRSARQRSVYQELGMPAGYTALLERHTGQAQQAPSAIHVAALQVQDNDSLFSEITSLYGVRLADLMQVQPVSASVVKVTGTAPLAASDIGQGNGKVLHDLQHWPQLGGQPLLLYTLSYHTDEDGDLDAILLGAPVRLRAGAGADARIVLLLLRCAPDPDTGLLAGEIIGARDIDFDDSDAPPDRVDQDIYEGDTVEPVHVLYDLEKQAPVTGADGEIAIDFGPPVTMALDSALQARPLAPGAHTLILSVTDLAGGVGFSPPLAFIKA